VNKTYQKVLKSFLTELFKNKRRNALVPSVHEGIDIENGRQTLSRSVYTVTVDIICVSRAAFWRNKW